MKFKSYPTAYEQLNAKQKEQYNFHFASQKLMENGYDIVWLSNDWLGADFLAVREEETLKIQLKGRFTVDKKYIGKDLWVAFIEDGKIKLYKHDLAVSMLTDNVKSSVSWQKGTYTWNVTPKHYYSIISEL